MKKLLPVLLILLLTGCCKLKETIPLDDDELYYKCSDADHNLFMAEANNETENIKQAKEVAKHCRAMQIKRLKDKLERSK